ncbi:transaldolase family protein [Streptomyces sp. NPDC007157]|uniref:transaldolase family protein n=1 Tax=Streptomyces sp. NPDC007157 TaxID=3154681 RepID=UPI00341150BC
MITRPRSKRSGVLNQLTAEGVGLWLDDYHRGRLADGGLERLVAGGLLGGVVSRPAAVARAMSDSTVYGDQLNRLSGTVASAEDRVYAILAEDARAACTALEPVFRATKGMHGWVSLGIAPRPAADAEAMADHSGRLAQIDHSGRLTEIDHSGRLAEIDHSERLAQIDHSGRLAQIDHSGRLAQIDHSERLAEMVDHSRRLAEMVDRPNVLIRIPVAGRGLAAVGDVLAHGVAVHVTSVYSVQRYAQAVEAYFHGLERAAAGGHAASAVASLVSLDIGRLDARVDALLDGSADPGAATLRGQAGVATARLVYRRYEESLGCPHWRSLVAEGARPQRLLWTSENTPESARAALDRVERLIAWMTLHALPQPALEALNRREGFHGDTLSGEHGAACRVVEALGEVGVVLDSVARDLEAAATASECAAWDRLLTAVQAG